MKERNNRINPVVAEGSVLLILSLAGIVFSIVSHYGFKVEWKLSPYLFPLVICIMLSLLSVSLIISGLSGMKEGKKEKGDRRTFVLFLAECAVYLFALKYLGFLICTVILLGAIVHLLGERSWWKIVLISVVTSVIIYLLFGVYLGVMLPKGRLLYMVGIRL
ncbi:MAG: tripartite tricarboxylate transporter TctB family protein [Bullifex sp.]